MLAALGLVRLQHGKRTEVLPEEDWNLLSSTVQEALRRAGRAEDLLPDLYEFRSLIEPKAAARMAEHASEQAVSELQDLVAALAKRAEEGDTAAVLDFDREFHNLIARASGSRVLSAVSRDIREMLATLWRLSRLGPDELLEIARQHALIADAIAARDADAAERAMCQHLEWAAAADLAKTEA
jgi:DNA-binding FadR family transcriptional regulator